MLKLEQGTLVPDLYQMIEIVLLIEDALSTRAHKKRLKTGVVF